MGILMKNPITTSSPSREYFFLEVNGRISSMHRRYEDAVSAGLQLKHQFPHDDVKLCEAHPEKINQENGLH